MARSPREELEGAIHHVYARGNRRGQIFVDDADRSGYLSLLDRVARRQGWACLSYCLMTTHVHLLIETPLANLGSGMQRLHGDYATGFNRRHGTSGHLFQGRFGSVRVTGDDHLVTIVRYIASNPVRAGLCARDDAWPWSSAAALRGAAPPPWLAIGRLWHLTGGLLPLE